MNTLTQTPTRTAILSNCFIALQPGVPDAATSRDYGFDLDEQEIGSELIAVIPLHLVDQSVVHADTYCALHFLS
jgi:hypothetical protein